MFTGELDLVALTQPGLWSLDTPLTWADPQITVTCPRGFVTDLASIPRPLRGLLDVNGRSRLPAVIHDWLYAAQTVTRAQADDLLRRMLLEQDMSPAAARLYWLGVRVGGWVSWDDDAGVPMSRRFCAPAYYRAWIASQPPVAVEAA